MTRAICAAFALSLGLLGGCKGDRAKPGPAPPITVPERALAAPPSMQMSVTDVRADPSLDAHAIASQLKDAETALLTCVTGGGSTGILVLTFPIERDGAVGDIVEGEKTTYGSEAVRVCMERIVATMRFPRGPTAEGRAEVTVTLEMSPRR